VCLCVRSYLSHCSAMFTAFVNYVYLVDATRLRFRQRLRRTVLPATQKTKGSGISPSVSVCLCLILSVCLSVFLCVSACLCLLILAVHRTAMISRSPVLRSYPRYVYVVLLCAYSINNSKLHWRSTGSVLATSAGLLLASSICASSGMKIGPVLRRQCWHSAGRPMLLTATDVCICICICICMCNCACVSVHTAYVHT